MPRIVFVALALLAAIALTSCGAAIESSPSMLGHDDPLYLRAQSECGDAPILRMLDAAQETICCAQGDGPIPVIHCMQADMPTLVNPSAKLMAKMRQGHPIL